MHHHVDHAVIEQEFGALEAVGQGLADGLLDDPLPGEADDRAGLGERDVAEHGEGGGNPARGRVAEQHDIGQARLLDLLDRDHRARQLHERQDALLHARAARGGDGDERGLLEHRELGGGEQRLAHGHAHGTAHEAEVEGGDHDRHAAHLAVGDQDRLLLLGLDLRLLEALGVAFAVPELERVGRRFRQLDGLVDALVEQHPQALLGADTQVVAAVRADQQVGLELAVEDHLGAGQTLAPQVIRHLLVHQRPDLGADEVGDPIHARSAFMPGLPFAPA